MGLWDMLVEGTTLGTGIWGTLEAGKDKQAAFNANQANIRKVNREMNALRDRTGEGQQQYMQTMFGDVPGVTTAPAQKINMADVMQQSADDWRAKGAQRFGTGPQDFNLDSEMLFGPKAEPAYGEGLFGEAYGGAMDRWQTAADELKGQYQGRETRIKDMLAGMGDQERKDILERFQGLESTTKQQMVDQGMGGTTVAPTMMAGVERERSGALGRHEEGLRQQMANWDASLSGQTLAQESALAGQRTGYDFGIVSDMMGGLERGKQQELSYDMATTTGLTDFLGGIQHEGPAYGSYVPLMSSLQSVSANMTAREAAEQQAAAAKSAGNKQLFGSMLGAGGDILGGWLA